jgi:hypothetical protein
MRPTPLLGAAALALCLAFGTAACGSDSAGEGDDERDEMVDDLSSTLQEGDELLSDDDADCLAGVIVDEVGLDALKDVDLTADTPPEELREQITAAQPIASEECDVPLNSDG